MNNIKMSDVFIMPVDSEHYSPDEIGHVACIDSDGSTLFECLRDEGHIDKAVEAINSHDKLVEENERLSKELAEANDYIQNHT